MRAWVGSVVLLLLLVLAPSASAHAPGVEVTVDEPVRTFEQQACIPLCEQPVWTQFTPGLPLVIESGATVTWTVLDTYHTATESVSLGTAPCFDARAWPDDPGRASFQLRPDGLWALTEGDTNWKHCDRATGLGDGSYAVTYNCIFHPTVQRSALVVVPGV